MLEKNKKETIELDTIYIIYNTFLIYLFMVRGCRHLSLCIFRFVVNILYSSDILVLLMVNYRTLEGLQYSFADEWSTNCSLRCIFDRLWSNLFCDVIDFISLLSIWVLPKLGYKKDGKRGLIRVWKERLRFWFYKSLGWNFSCVRKIHRIGF